ncbi:MAG: HD domain-containing protein [Xanthomonadaceae bacterium]|nr:HD domain-containing protein [Xanthomonadaceae bacterium]MDP2185900.1 HD domain-containing protein [Xanthomonadales bacterium]MDZ4116312.1 HD domain-containing protein [Xanthomonadaceae bacterium]MDZ4377927.1 HD domain-containing protein [Xanthomonadaceae bacterium]
MSGLRARIARLGRYRLRILLVGGLGGLFVLMLLALAFSAWALALSQRDQSLMADLRRLDTLVARYHSDAERYLRNAPRDYPDYFRDTTLYFAQLKDDVEQVETLFASLSDQRSRMEQTPWALLLLGPSAAGTDPRFDPLRDFWRSYRKQLQQALGPDADEPRLEWAARHIVEQSGDLAGHISQISSSLQQVIKSHQRHARLVGQWGVMLTLIVSALGIIVLIRSLTRRVGTTQHGCEQIARGYFGHQIPDRSNDELGSLNTAINTVSTRMGAVLRLLDGIQRGADLHATAREVRDALGAFLPADWLGLYDNDPDSRSVQLREQFPELPGHGFDMAEQADLKSNKRFAVYEASFALPDVATALSAQGFQTVLVLSLPSESGPGFTLVLAARSANAFSHDAQALLGNLAPVIAHGFEKSALSEQLLLAAVNGLSKLAESRDPETGNHLIRMSHYAHAIARQFIDKTDSSEVLPPGFARDVLRFASMHDIGKVGVPDSILLKPGHLSDAERTEMRMHPLIGGSVLRACAGQLPESSRDLFKIAIDIAEGHHEWFDGGGYPAGTRGRDIPLAARIVAVADVFDALTSKRPYKEAWSLQRGLDYLREQSGKHFDPAVIAAFERAMPQINEVYERYRHV